MGGWLEDRTQLPVAHPVLPVDIAVAKLVSCVPPRKLGDGLFLQCCKEVAARYPQITFENMIVDNTTMQVVNPPGSAATCPGCPELLMLKPLSAPSLPCSWCPGPSSLMSW